MSTALALVSPSDLSSSGARPTAERTSDAPASQTRARTSEPPFVYGDSTPFPYDWGCIVGIRESVRCAVELLRVQHALLRARARESEVERRRQIERMRLASMGDAVKRTIDAESQAATEPVTRTGHQIIAAARAAVDAEMSALESASQMELARLRDGMVAARDRGFAAVHALLSKHDMPGTRVGFRLVARENGYAAEALVTSPFGIHAVFDLEIAEEHAWGKKRRVADVRPDTCVHVPTESGWFSKRMEMKRLSLDKLFVLAASADGERGMLILGKGTRAAGGYEIEIDASGASPQVILSELAEDGSETSAEAFELGSEDRTSVLRLWSAIRASVADVLPARQAMTSARIDGKELRAEEPHVVSRRMVDALAPLAQEIARRSGALGELVLRRNVRSGRRDEVYITKAELLEMVMTLPPPLRTVFDRLELEGAPRSPRAPEPSLAAYEEVDADAVLED